MNRRQTAKLPIAERFALKSQPVGECIEWTGGINSGGYGQTTIAGKYQLVHRVAYEEAHGPIPVGMYVCHSCDRKTCINPDHLWVGTPTENIQDAIAKGRMWWQAPVAQWPAFHRRVAA